MEAYITIWWVAAEGPPCRLDGAVRGDTSGAQLSCVGKIWIKPNSSTKSLFAPISVSVNQTHQAASDGFLVTVRNTGANWWSYWTVKMGATAGNMTEVANATAYSPSAGASTTTVPIPSGYFYTVLTTYGSGPGKTVFIPLK